MAISHNRSTSNTTLPDDEWVEITDHAYDRWHERKPAGTMIGPRVAWFADETVILPRPNGVHGDSARYHPGTETVLVERNRFIVTVLLASKADGELRAALDRLNPETPSEPAAVPRS